MSNANTQSTVYNLDFKREMAFSGSIFALGVANYTLNNQLKTLNSSDLNLLEYDDILPIDYGAIRNWSTSHATASDWLQRFSFVYPLTLFAFEPIRNEAPTVALLYTEVVAINALITNATKVLSKRSRPFVYNPDIPDEKKFTKSARKSFYSGHTSNTAALSFLTAKIYSDFFPDSKLRPYVWAFSASIPAVTGYFRYKAGKHFPTDVMIGYTLGALIGYLIPELHKIGDKNFHFNVSTDPILNSSGVQLAFTF